MNIQEYLSHLTTQPGVYRMYDAKGDLLYVGKARNLKNRVSSYFRGAASSVKTAAMVAHVVTIDVMVTHTENEALILENNLIKSLKPRYNILLRDDKSYPYIYLSSDHDFPRLAFHRGAKSGKGHYFGPYPSAGAVRESLQILQKIFPVRQCEESFYKNRSRPCLQYQIKRCTAPCVGLVDKQAYGEEVQHAVLFLQGKSSEVINTLAQRMESAAAALAFERAAHYRDQISQLSRLQERQYVSSEGGDIDVVAAVVERDSACVQLFFIRNGHNLGNKSFYPSHTQSATAAEVLAAFLPQYYLGKATPAEILINTSVEELELLAATLTLQAGHKVAIRHQVRGERLKWVALAEH
ncbi:MAG: excinuclease ABC subunit C, partial [Halothiobacillaceae bacterium]